MNQHRKILVVEDDKNLAYLTGEILSDNGFIPCVCNSAEQGIEKIQNASFDLCLLDIVLPDMDGLELAKKIRQIDPKTPLIFLSSRNLKSDKLIGYEVGADDYITKPFDPDLLIVRIKAIMKRCYENDIKEQEIFELSSHKLDLAKRCLISMKKEIKLSGTECGILKVLFKANGRPVSRTDILMDVWEKNDFFVSNSLDVYLSRLRKMLKENTKLKLETIHGYGYALTDE